MKKVFGLLVLFCVGAIIFNVIAYSSRPDELSTGAPGETSCLRCHTGAPLNELGGELTINFDNNNSSYQLGKEYEIVVTANKADISTFGFEIVALQKSTNLSVGRFIVTDTLRTQAFSSTLDMDTREYIGHTKLGVEANIVGINTWSFKWLSPTADMGEITFYAASVMSNSSGNRFGDRVYTKHIPISSDVNAVIEPAKISKFIVYALSPDMLKVRYHLASPALTHIRIVDSKGEVLQVLKNTFEDGGDVNEHFAIAPHLPGIYFVQFYAEGKSISKKVIL